MMQKRSSFGWLELAIGIILILLGILAFFKPDLALTSMVFAYGLTAIIMGATDIYLYIKIERYIGFGPLLSLIAGVLSVMAGIMLVGYPKTGAIVLSILFPIWFIAHCISRLTQLNHIRFVAGDTIYYLILIINIIGLILGIAMMFSPIFTLRTLRYLASLYMTLLGIDSIIMAFSRMGKHF